MYAIRSYYEQISPAVPPVDDLGFVAQDDVGGVVVVDVGDDGRRLRSGRGRIVDGPARKIRARRGNHVEPAVRAEQLV